FPSCLGGQLDRRTRRMRVDRSDGSGGIPDRAPLRKVASLQEHLRRVNERGMLPAHFFVLTLGKYRAREAIFPAEPIPIIDVQGERHCALALATVPEPRQPTICGRTTVATLRCIKLDQGDRIVRARS